MKVLNILLKQMKNHYKIIIIVLLAIGAFYWFEWRPLHIKSTCENSALKGAQHEYQSQNPWDKNKDTFYNKDYTLYYEMCTRAKGL